VAGEKEIGIEGPDWRLTRLSRMREGRRLGEHLYHNNNPNLPQFGTAIGALQEQEKKMLRAEKRKFTDQQRQIAAIKDHLFPSGGLQERFDNIGYWYAKYGKEIIARLYENSMALDQEFVLLSEKD